MLKIIVETLHFSIKKLLPDRFKAIAACIGFFPALLAAQDLPRTDSVFLRTGVVLTGKILEVDENRVLMEDQRLPDGREYKIMKKGLLKIVYGNSLVEDIGTKIAYEGKNVFERRIQTASVPFLMDTRPELLKKRKADLGLGILAAMVGSVLAIEGFVRDGNYGEAKRTRITIPLGVGIGLLGVFKIAQGAARKNRVLSINSELERRGVDPAFDTPDSLHPLLK